MRLFVAVEPSAPVRERLDALIGDLRRRFGNATDALRWTAAHQSHLTLHFLGEVAEAKFDALQSALGERLPQAPFDVAFDHLGIFPTSGDPRVLWIGASRGTDGLSAVHAELAARLRAAVVGLEGRAFTPHLTLARVREGRGRDVRSLRQQLASVSFEPLVWTVASVTLFESDIRTVPVRHEPRQTIALT